MLCNSISSRRESFAGIKHHFAIKAERSGESQQSPGQTKDNKGQVSDHSTQVDPQQQSAKVVEKKKVKWPTMADEKAWREFDEDITMMLENTLKGTSKRKLEVMGDMIYDCGRVRLVDQQVEEGFKITYAFVEESSPWRKTWTCRGSRASKIKACITPKCSSQHRKRKKSERSRRSFYDNPHRFTKTLFESSKSGEQNIPQQELEEHLKNTYSDQQHVVPMPDIVGLVRPTKPDVDFDLSEPQLAEVEMFINKARAAFAPGPNGVPYKIYRKTDGLRKSLWRLLKVVCRQDVVPLSWSEAEGVYNPKEENSSTSVREAFSYGIYGTRYSIFIVIQWSMTLCFIESQWICRFPCHISYENASRTGVRILPNVWHLSREDIITCAWKWAHQYICTEGWDTWIPRMFGAQEHDRAHHTRVKEVEKEPERCMAWPCKCLWLSSLCTDCVCNGVPACGFQIKVRNFIMQYYSDFHMRFTTNQFTKSWQS